MVKLYLNVKTLHRGVCLSILPLRPLIVRLSNDNNTMSGNENNPCATNICEGGCEFPASPDHVSCKYFKMSTPASHKPATGSSRAAGAVVAHAYFSPIKSH